MWNEKGGGITAWRFDARTGKLTQLQTLSTVPPDFEGRSAAADIQITPNGRFAYISNRDVTERSEGEAMQDTLTGVSLDPSTGAMELIGYFPTAYFPRSFCIDLTGRFVYSAGQRSSTLFAYRIDQSTGRLEHFATYETDGVPLWVSIRSSLKKTGRNPSVQQVMKTPGLTPFMFPPRASTITYF